MNFDQFNFRSELLQAIKDLGFDTPTPIQAQTIPLVMAGSDVIGCAQTGTGKTAAFSLPVINAMEPGEIHPQMLVISPTRELAEQILVSIQDFTRHLSLRSTVVYGGVSSRSQLPILQKGVDILVATPGRLLDHLTQRTLRLTQVRYLVLDEADRMLDMGFIPDIEEIMSYVPRKRQTLLFSATMPPEIEKLARKMTQNATMVEVSVRNSASDSVEQSVCFIGQRDKFKLLTRLLQHQDTSSTIIFTKTKLGAANLTRSLEQVGIAAAPIHADLMQSHRQRSLDGFKRGDYKVLVATDIAARGIDIDHVSHVINYDTPTHPEDYIHRIGRTGRASSTGVAYTFTSPDEMRHLKNIEKLIGKKLLESELVKQLDPARAAKAVKGKGADSVANHPHETISRHGKSAKNKAQSAKDQASVPAKQVKAAKSEKVNSKAPPKEVISQRSGKAPRAEAPALVSPQGRNGRDDSGHPGRQARSSQSDASLRSSRSERFEFSAGDLELPGQRHDYPTVSGPLPQSSSQQQPTRSSPPPRNPSGHGHGRSAGHERQGGRNAAYRSTSQRRGRDQDYIPSEAEYVYLPPISVAQERERGARFSGSKNHAGDRFMHNLDEIDYVD